jgi:hypothetical protein
MNTQAAAADATGKQVREMGAKRQEPGNCPRLVLLLTSETHSADNSCLTKGFLLSRSRNIVQPACPVISTSRNTRISHGQMAQARK